LFIDCCLLIVSLFLTGFGINIFNHWYPVKIRDYFAFLPITDVRNMQIINYIYQLAKDCFAFRQLTDLLAMTLAMGLSGVKGCGEAAPFHS